MEPKLIVFDLSKSLIQENAWLELNLAMGVTQAEDDQLMAWGEADIISDQQGQDIICAIYQQRGNPTRERIWDVLSHYTFVPGAMECVQKLHDGGFELALLSGSINLLVEKVAGELNIDTWYAANTFVFDDNGVLARIEAPQKDTADKAAQLRKICEEKNVALSDVLVVGDGSNNSEMFEITGNGVTFTGSKIEDKARIVIGSIVELPGVVGLK